MVKPDGSGFDNENGTFLARPGPFAFISNRLGDFGFMLGILTFWAWSNSLNFSEINKGLVDWKGPHWFLTVGGLLIFCGAMGKSAQFPLHVWLPDAMEAEWPV